MNRPQELVDDLIEVKKFEDDFKMPKCTPQKVKKYFKDKFSISVSTIINCYYRVNYLRYAELSLGVWCTANQLCFITRPGCENTTEITY